MGLYIFFDEIRNTYNRLTYNQALPIMADSRRHDGGPPPGGQP